jgi:hypothetical protein
VRTIIQFIRSGPDGQTTSFNSPAIKTISFSRETLTRKREITQAQKKEEGEIVRAQTPLGERQTPALKTKREKEQRVQEHKSAETSCIDLILNLLLYIDR